MSFAEQLVSADVDYSYVLDLGAFQTSNSFVAAALDAIGIDIESSMPYAEEPLIGYPGVGNLLLEEFSRTLDGTSGNDTVRGGDLDDLLSASVGNDTIEGRSGDDIVLGGSGDDNLDGGQDDSFFGGESIDTVHYVQEDQISFP